MCDITRWFSLCCMLGYAPLAASIARMIRVSSLRCPTPNSWIEHCELERFDQTNTIQCENGADRLTAQRTGFSEQLCDHSVFYSISRDTFWYKNAIINYYVRAFLFLCVWSAWFVILKWRFGNINRLFCFVCGGGGRWWHTGLILPVNCIIPTAHTSVVNSKSTSARTSLESERISGPLDNSTWRDFWKQQLSCCLSVARLSWVFQRSDFRTNTIVFSILVCRAHTQ